MIFKDKEYNDITTNKNFLKVHCINRYIKKCAGFIKVYKNGNIYVRGHKSSCNNLYFRKRNSVNFEANALKNNLSQSEFSYKTFFPSKLDILTWEK